MDLQYENDYSAIVEADRAERLAPPDPAQEVRDRRPADHHRGQGHPRLEPKAGREHLDATSGGVWTVNVGYGRDAHC